MTTDTASCAVDPHQLLKALSTLLTPQGEIKSPDNVAKILSLMKSAKKLVSRCIYINILRATQDEEVMNKFISDGGWELLNGWLQDAKESNNTPVILELIKVFKQLPVTIEILKKNNTAKLIKQLSKGVDEKLKEVANELVDSWLSVIRHSQDGKEKPVVKKKPKIKKVEKKDSPSTDNKEESKTDSSDKVSKASKRTVSNNHNSDAKHSERTKEGPSKAKTPRRDSIDDDIPLSRLKKMDSKSPSGKEKSPGKTEEEKPVRRRTAKVPQTKFRSTGLEKDAQLPPIKIKKKTVVPPAVTNKPKPEKLLPVKREGPIFSKSLTPPDKKPKTVTSPTQNKIKLIPAKAKSHVQESSMFMSALNAPAPVVRKKRRPSNKPTSPTTNKEPKPEPPKFGFYAAIQQEEEKTDSKETSEKKEGDVKSEDSAAKTEVNGAKKKKSVKWKPESELVEIKYFELDATERVNVNKAKDFRDAAQMEMMMERQAVKNAMRGGSSLFNEDGMSEQHQTVEYFPWPKLIKIDLSMIQTVDYGCNSKERDIQKQREMVVLAEIYFDKNMVPETPQEPEPESYNPKEPKKIPLEDETAVETTQGSIPPFQPDYQPQHQHHPPQQQQQPFANLPPGFPQNLQNLDIPPDMAQILQQIPMQGMQGGGPPGPQGQQQHMQGNEQPSPNPTIRNVQNLLSSIMDNQGSTSQEDLTNKLREMLEPFKNQLPGAMGMGQHQQNQGMPPPDGMPPPFGNPGEFGPPPGMGGMPPRGALLPPPPPPFPDGPGPGPGPHPRGMGPHFGGPGPHFQPGPQFQGGPGGGPNDGWGGPNDGWGGENQQMHGGPPMGRGRGRGMGGRGRGRGRGEGGQGRGQGGRPVCRHFMSPKGCMRGNSCMFYHPGVHGPPLQNNGPPPPLLPNPE